MLWNYIVYVFIVLNSFNSHTNQNSSNNLYRHSQLVVFQAPEMSSSSDGLAGSMPFGGPSASDKLELARKLAQRINLQHNIGKEAKGASQQAAEFILKGGAAMQPTISAKTVAEQVLCSGFRLLKLQF